MPRWVQEEIGATKRGLVEGKGTKTGPGEAGGDDEGQEETMDPKMTPGVDDGFRRTRRRRTPGWLQELMVHTKMGSGGPGGDVEL